MDDLVEWLLACIADDEAVAQLVSNWGGHVEHEMDGFSANARRYAVEMTPARVLATCAALRAVIDLHPLDPIKTYSWGTMGGGCNLCDHDCNGGGDTFGRGPCDTLRALATAYADRPGYRQEWKP